MYVSPLFNNNAFSHETLWVYTTIDTLHTDTLKTIIGRVKQCNEISQVLDIPSFLWSEFLFCMSDLWAPALKLSTNDPQLPATVFRILAFGIWPEQKHFLVYKWPDKADFYRRCSIDDYLIELIFYVCYRGNCSINFCASRLKKYCSVLEILKFFWRRYRDRALHNIVEFIQKWLHSIKQVSILFKSAYNPLLIDIKNYFENNNILFDPINRGGK